MALVAALPGMASGQAFAQAQPAADAAPDPAAHWPLEQVTLSSGRVYRGLIESPGAAGIEFAEVHRQPGKPMHLVVRSIDRRSIVSWERLPAAEHAQLRQRLDRFRNRASIEGRRMEDLNLTPVVRDDTVYWQYRGAWFSLDSTADEPTTRRSIVRLEQVFTAYRQILPARTQTERRLQIMLFGATDQYRNFLRGLGIETLNPAFFAADFNLVVAGSDMNGFVAQLAKVRHRHQAAKEDLERQMAELPPKIAALAEQLKQNGLTEKECQKILNAEKAKWKEQERTLLAAIAAQDRKNAARFKEVAGQMFARLYHEAFHAYLENCVYPHHDYDVPRWLNEGLAQTFETGLLEEDSLRVDAPNRAALTQLQADLQSGSPLSLIDLLSADGGAFMQAHRGDAESASRLYRYSWGLAYYLTFEQPILGTAAFDRYVNPAVGEETSIERFETLVGMPLEQFEAKWRTAMLRLKG